MKFKKLITVITCAVLCGSMFSSVPITAEDAPLSKDIASVSNNDLTIEGANSFGQMLAGALDKKASEQTQGNGCNVFSVEVNEQKATVDLQTTEDCTLIVAVYEDDGVKMLDSVIAEVSAEDTSAEVTFANSLPEHYYLRAFLVDNTVFLPLSPVHEDPMHTLEMQAFLAKTTDDFDSDRVLNLDDDKTNNFAVYNNTVVLLENSDGTLISEDDSSQTYVFSNAGSKLKGLKSGDTFAYGATDDVLIVGIDTIEINGNTVTVRGAHKELDEVFDYIKIDEDADMSNAEVDTSTVNDDLEYVGRADENFQAQETAVNSRKTNAVMQQDIYEQKFEYDSYDSKALLEERKLNAISGGSSITIGDTYKIYSNEDKDLEGNYKKIQGSFTWGLTGSVKVYFDIWNFNSSYIELKVDYKAALNLKLELYKNVKYELASYRIPLCKVVYLSITPSLIFEGKITASINATLSGTVGIKVSPGGNEDLTTTPVFTSDLKIEGTLFVGLSLEPKLTVLADWIGNAKLTGKAGVELKASYTKKIANTASKQHECSDCIAGELYAKFSVSGEFKLFNQDWLSAKAEFLNIKFKICDFYYSITYNDLGWGGCPHYLFRVDIHVTASDADDVEGATVTVDGKEYTTDKNGIVSLMLPKKRYNITAVKDDKNGNYILDDVSAGKYVNIMITKPLTFDTNPLDPGNDDPHNPGGDDPTNLVTDQVLSLGLDHSAYIDKKGDLYIWGMNNYGQLGTADITDRYSPVKIMSNVKAISLGYHHSACITENGDLYTWGNNNYGQLGTGDTKITGTPIKIMSNVKAVSLGYEHSACITENGDLYTWGYNGYGQLGTGDTTARYCPVKIMSNAKAISLERSYNACITENGDLYTWGYNYNGRLGTGDKDVRHNPVKIMSNVKEVSLGWEHISCLTENGDLYTWGDNYRGQLGTGDTTARYCPVKIMSNVKAVSFGGRQSACITENGDLYTWGNNNYGQLGTGDTKITGTPIKIMSNVKAVSLGGYHSVCITENSDLYTCGWNKYGQLGTGTADEDPHTTPICITNKFGADAVLATQALNAAPKPIDTPAFTDLTPNAVYNIYALKNADGGLNTKNLMYINQLTTDENSKLTFDYGLKENTDVKWLAVPMEQEDISDAEVTLSNMEYTGEEQYAEPVVKLNSETLTFGRDYYLEGDFIAKESGEYTLTICGTGLYCGKKTVNYVIPRVIASEETTVMIKPKFDGKETKTYTDITLTAGGKTFTADSTGKITITELANGTYEAVVSKPTYAPRNVTITVGAANDDIVICKYGDVTGNGDIDTEDIARMQQKISKWNVKYVYDETADLNGDGEMDTEDLARLQQYISGWNVKLGKAS